jgi:hypothetical protein
MERRERTAHLLPFFVETKIKMPTRERRQKGNISMGRLAVQLQRESREKKYHTPTQLSEHFKRLKGAHLLLFLYVSMTTKEVPAHDGGRDGLVMDGKPIRDQDVAAVIGCSIRTVRAWRACLAKFGYIEQRHTPVGYVIRTKKSKRTRKPA